ncbi:cysteine-rich motor neuron 1 protein-like isoform X2 [Apostichopus japonicus]
MADVYLPGEVWSPHPCADCSCTDLHSECTIRTCPTCDGQESAVAPDQCCAKCDGKAVKPNEKGFCNWRGIRYDNGESFTLNPCTDCYCDGGIASCVVRSCPPYKCDNPVAVEGKCCPVCPKAAKRVDRLI